MQGTFLFLGTGASSGVPLIGCKCPVCTSSAPKNKRLRPSGLIELDGKKLLIDIGPDFRAQALRFHIDTIDALLLTHTHYDHIAGIDEVRIFNVRKQQAIPCLLSQESFEELKRRYYYFFGEKGTSAKLDFFPLTESRGSIRFLELAFSYCSFFQSGMQVTGFRMGDFAYISDLKEYDKTLYDFLKGVRQLVVSALRPEPSPSHLCFAEAVEFADRVGAEFAWLTHMGHFVDHEQGNALLPSHVQMAYDGLKLEFTCTS